MDPLRGISIIRTALKGTQQSTERMCRSAIYIYIYSPITHDHDHTIPTQDIHPSDVSNSLECVNILLLQPAGQHQERLQHTSKVWYSTLVHVQTNTISALTVYIL